MYLHIHVAAIAIFGIGQGLMQGIFTVISANKVPKELRSIFLGLLKTISCLSGILSGLMVGYFDSFDAAEDGTNSMNTAAWCLVGCGAMSFLWVKFCLGDVSRKTTTLYHKRSDEGTEKEAEQGDGGGDGDGEHTDVNDDDDETKLLRSVTASPIQRKLVRSASYSALSVMPVSVEVVEEKEEDLSWIQLDTPFFELGSNMDVGSFNEFRRNYLKYRAGASHGARGEITESV